MATEKTLEATLIEKLIEQLVANAQQTGKIEERFDRLDDRVSHLETDIAQIKIDVGKLDQRLSRIEWLVTLDWGWNCDDCSCFSG